MSNSGTMIPLEVNGKSTSAYWVTPAGTSPWPGVVVIQEWWGVEEHIKGVADRFAAEGFVAIAPDLYYGEVATEPDEARKLAMALDWDDALAAVQASIDLLLASEQVSSTQAGLIGFCMGGGLVWHGSAKLKNVGAAAPFYGGGPEMSDEEVSHIQPQILAIYGELDEGVSPQVARSRAAQMDEAGITHETIIYPEADHAFFNELRPVYNAAAAADAWQHVIKLFRETLHPAGQADDAWSEVGRQFQSLGQSLAAAFKTALDSEENRQYVQNLQSGLSQAADELAKATRQAVDSEEAQKLQSEVGKAAQSAAEAGKQAAADVQPHIINAFQRIKTELDRAITHMEQKSTPSDSTAETPADIKDD